MMTFSIEYRMCPSGKGSGSVTLQDLDQDGTTLKERQLTRDKLPQYAVFQDGPFRAQRTAAPL